MTRAMPAAAQPLPTPQKAFRSKAFRSSSQMWEKSLALGSQSRRRIPSICFTASAGAPATARKGGAMYRESIQTCGL